MHRTGYQEQEQELATELPCRFWVCLSFSNPKTMVLTRGGSDTSSRRLRRRSQRSAAAPDSDSESSGAEQLEDALVAQAGAVAHNPRAEYFDGGIRPLAGHRHQTRHRENMEELAGTANVVMAAAKLKRAASKAKANVRDQARVDDPPTVSDLEDATSDHDGPVNLNDDFDFDADDDADDDGDRAALVAQASYGIRSYALAASVLGNLALVLVLHVDVLFAKVMSGLRASTCGGLVYKVYELCVPA